MNDDLTGTDFKWDQVRVIWADVKENDKIT